MFGILKLITPLMLLICRTALLLEEQARMFTSGLYFETSLAILPESVRTMIREISFYSRTAEHTAEATDSAVEIGRGVYNFNVLYTSL